MRGRNNEVLIMLLSSSDRCYEIKAFYSDSHGHNLII
jgi:hypothetical protein